MEQFVGVAIAHFLALLIPGVDFFLIVRTAITNGWRNATGVCVGIAVANGILIVAAFSGISSISHPVAMNIVQLAGGGFLVFVGFAFLRSKATVDFEQRLSAESTTWRRNFNLGIASGLLNPKNSLFYVSLAAAVHAETPLKLALYGIWMVTILLIWDTLVAMTFGSRRALVRMERFLPWLSKIAGGFLVIFGAGMVLRLIAGLSL